MMSRERVAGINAGLTIVFSAGAIGVLSIHEQQYVIGKPLTAGLVYDTEAGCLAARSVWIKEYEGKWEKTARCTASRPQFQNL